MDSFIQIAVHFSLTPGDSMSFTSNFTVEEAAANVVPLPMAAWAGLALIGGVGLHRTARRATPET